MATYRIFKRSWWRGGKPHAGRKNYSGQTAATTEGARAICRANSIEDYGKPDGRGPNGMAWEFEQA